MRSRFALHARLRRGPAPRLVERLRRIAILGHDRDCREHRDAGLAHPDDMHARAKYLQKGGDVIDKLVEAELVLPQADVARVVPVGDIDVMVGEKRLRMPRSKVAKCPDIGATSSTWGCAPAMSFSRCNRVQNGV
jgi:hypothetical protein